MSDVECPACGSVRCERDFEPECGFFWTCQNCSHQWSYAHENAKFRVPKVIDDGSTEPHTEDQIG
jgi:ribosomal protein L37AE/L43A